MKETNKIIGKYYAEEATLEETNAALEAIGSNLRLDPNANALTEEEIFNTYVGDAPEKTSGYGLLDTGTGTLNKVKVEQGKLVDNDMGTMIAFLFIGDKVYRVEGDTLTNVD